jgi:hypothetical protein
MRSKYGAAVLGPSHMTVMYSVTVLTVVSPAPSPP